MEKQKYAKIFKWISLALLVVSVVILVWGFLTGFEKNDGKAVDVLLGWAYIMLGLNILVVICVGIYISATTNPKSLARIGIALLAAVVLVGIAALLAPGQQPLGYNGGVVSAGDLKLTETILNLTYILGGAAILSIIAGEIISSIKGKKA